MASSKLRNPLAFATGPVTVWTFLVYFALFTALLVVHTEVPVAPSRDEPVPGISLDQAWRDLQELSNGFHPYNSKRNDEVRNWLLGRIESIIDQHGVVARESSDSPVQVFNDMKTNITFSSPEAKRSVYFEGSNIMVYIRGTDDGSGESWVQDSQGGVLVNAHYDSVSTGLGTTDDGVGVISILQLLSHFLVKKPKRGVVLLLNNGEEDYLNGARAFAAHPLSGFTRSFLNLEGAATGGRATLFRSTSTEVTRAYKSSKYPYGMVLSSDGFQRGLIASQTDYIIFDGILGMQGLDVAFTEHRSRYHTAEDSPAFTSRDAVWHMLSAALATTRSLADDSSMAFDADFKGSDGVWWDMFGRSLAVLELHSMFAISVALLVVPPVVFIALTVLLHRKDKFYPFSMSLSGDDGLRVRLDTWRGVFRFPAVFVVATAAVIGLAFLVARVNPEIVYSSEYGVWAMMMTAWFSIDWFLLRGADATRPTALARFYGLMWIYAGSFVLLILNTVLENNFQVAGGYSLVIYSAAASAAFLVSFLELFALPKKSDFAYELTNSTTPATRRSSGPSSRPLTGSTERPAEPSGENENAEPTETTSLLREDRTRPAGTFARYGQHRSSMDAETLISDEENSRTTKEVHEGEQPWSHTLPAWLWLLEFILLAPIVIILLGQVGLLLTSSLRQTSADGSSVLTVYLAIAILTVLILTPLEPFIHRISFILPTIFFLIFIGTLIYNLVAFPFSLENKLKLYFIQNVDLDTGFNNVSLIGIDDYVRPITYDIPSAAASKDAVTCGPTTFGTRIGLTECTWPSLDPEVVQPLPPGIPPSKGFSSWVTLNATRDENNKARATIFVSGRNTRACRLNFDSGPVTDLYVEETGRHESDKFQRIGEDGSTELRLWSREWERGWTVHVEWEGDESSGLDGRAVCLWSDANASGTIPALDEVRRYLPKWAIVTKLSDGLVEGTKRFKV